MSLFQSCKFISCSLIHWGRVTQICVSKLTIIGSGNGLSPGRRQAIIWTNAGILLIGPIGTNFSEILIRIQTFSFKKMQLKMSSAKCHPICLSLNELICCNVISMDSMSVHEAIHILYSYPPWCPLSIENHITKCALTISRPLRTVNIVFQS